MTNNTQLSHEDHQRSSKTFPFSIIANDLSSPLNVGSLFRLSDALGINKLYLCGDTPLPPNSKINKTSRSAEKYVTYEYQESAIDLVDRLKQSGSLIIALELTTSSIDLSSAEFTAAIKNRVAEAGPVCLILGSEKTGISESLLSLSDISVHIKMFGHNSSMNVISAASIAGYEIIQKMETLR
jgi:tRNA G18 (ribose-2'-O)-methylase SpoU